MARVTLQHPELDARISVPETVVEHYRARGWVTADDQAALDDADSAARGGERASDPPQDESDPAVPVADQEV